MMCHGLVSMQNNVWCIDSRLEIRKKLFMTCIMEVAHQTRVCASLVSSSSIFKHPFSHVLRGECADDF